MEDSENRDERSPQSITHDEAFQSPQLLRYDEAHHGLQVDLAANAPEVLHEDRGERGEYLQPISIRHQNNPQQSHLQDRVHNVKFSPKDQEEKILSPQTQGPPPRFRPSKKQLRISIAILIICIITLGLGLGLGLTLGRQSSETGTSNPSPSTATTVPLGNSSTQASSLIQENSSFAAVALNSGDRILCFQDANNSIRRAVFSESSSEWSVEEIFLPDSAPAPRANTPLALSVYHQGYEAISLFYINTDNEVTQYAVNTNIQETDVYVIPNAISRLESKSLSIVSTFNANGSYYESLLFYENEAGNASSLHQIVNYESEDTANWTTPNNPLIRKWTNVSDALYASIIAPSAAVGTNATWGSPFTGGYINNTEWNQPILTSDDSQKLNSTGVLEGMFFDPYAPRNANMVVSLWLPQKQTFESVVQNFGQYPNELNVELGKASAPSDPDFVSSVQSSDIIMCQSPIEGELGYWINDTIVEPYFNLTNNTPSLPGNFPFTRLATLKNHTNVVPTYVYNQVNGTMFQEHTLDLGLDQWTTVNISVAALANGGGT